MNTFAGLLLLVLVIVLFNQWRKGTLPQWFASKFLNVAAR